MIVDRFFKTLIFSIGIATGVAGGFAAAGPNDDSARATARPPQEGIAVPVLSCEWRFFE